MDQRIQTKKALDMSFKDQADFMDETCVALTLKKATRAVTRRFDELLASSGLRSTQTAILLKLVVGGPLKLTDLANRLVMDKSTMSRNIRPLEELGLIKKQAVNGKRKHIFITPKGEKILEEVFPLWHKAQNEVLNSIKLQKWEEMSGTLSKISEYSPDRDY